MSALGFLVAWLDGDGNHVWLAHECVDGPNVTMLPWPTWQAIDGRIHPSVICVRPPGCGLHEVNAPVAHGNEIRDQLGRLRSNPAFAARLLEAHGRWTAASTEVTQ